MNIVYSPPVNKKRLTYIDILRGFAIILVCMGHLLNSAGPDNVRFSRFIYTFHMPLFMAISGFVAAYMTDFSYQELAWKERLANEGRFIWKKFVHLMVPYMAWPCLVYPFFFKTYHAFADYASIFNHLFIVNDSLWFLLCLFNLFVIFAFYKLAHSCCKRDSVWINLLILGVMFGVLKGAFDLSHWVPLRSVISYFIPFFMGVFMGQYPTFYRYLSENERVYTLGLLTIPLIGGFYMHDPDDFTGKVSRLICGCASVPLFFYWFKNHNWHPRLASALSYLGRNTMIIYILHNAWIPTTWDFSAYKLPFLIKFSMYPILSIMMILPVLAVNLLLEQSVLTRRLLLGRK